MKSHGHEAAASSRSHDGEQTCFDRCFHEGRGPLLSGDLGAFDRMHVAESGMDTDRTNAQGQVVVYRNAR